MGDTKKCETARHDKMPYDCVDSSHNRCGQCARCYTCSEKNMPATRIARTLPDAEETPLCNS